ncbi:MAG: DUF885 domain-containing protein [Candidatus Dormibacteraeota bacterium]|uniref:DUF885 domain-containing protein n=1 Tax=Candidatus Aeolococcus gillhamiae TaxID=3127015 RepID=A0A2W5Z4X4_9BACT|nr:DUF885 domain-containing protein [Candidatus Dormibacteraeota bacterium]PZR80323.1 MAG: hypothetical protein DLM65_08410 [Candidatus Dormibacter sp. RRmetagenome_bin12]
MSGPPLSTIAALGERYVAELFDFSPGDARTEGDHSFDGRLGPIGPEATQQRVRRLDETAAELDIVVPRGVDERADVITLRHRIALERFQLVELESARRNPLSGLFRGADPQPYCTHDYAPVPERAEGLDRHLDQLPGWLDAALDELGDSVDEGPRGIAVGVARGLAGFFAHDLDTALPLPDHPQLRDRLHAHAGEAAQACTRFATAVAARDAHPSPALGEERFLAMLHAQEGVTETVATLRAIASAELSRLRAEFEDVAHRISPAGGVPEAIAQMEDDHPSASSLIEEAAGSLERVRQFWRERGVVTIPDAPIRVTPSPPYMRFVSAAFDPAGSLAAPDVESNYVVTPVDESMSEKEADEWLRSFNRWQLENIGVHEVYPGHFVHAVHARRQRSLLRRVGFVSGFGEGWAHYTEQLAIEQGLAEGRPLLHLAQLQDALLRACRFAATLMLHTEGVTVEDATAFVVETTGLPEFPSRREAARGMYDPMYLAYTYGKLAILDWRADLKSSPGFSLRGFHDTMLGSGLPPLAAVRELLFNPD